MVLEKKKRKVTYYIVFWIDNDCIQIEGSARGTVTDVHPVTNKQRHF